MEKDYELADFERPALDLSKPVLLPGKAGMGKTQYAMAHGKYPLRIKTLDDLKKIVDGTTDLLVFDDMVFGPGTKENPGNDLPDNTMLALLDFEQETSIGKDKDRTYVRNDTGKIPKRMKRIFLTNIRCDGSEKLKDMNGRTLHPFPYGGTAQIQAALDRRYRLEPYVEEPLFSVTKAVVRRLVKQVISNVKRDLCPVV